MITAAPLCQRRQLGCCKARAALPISAGPLWGLSGLRTEPEGRKLPADRPARRLRGRGEAAWRGGRTAARGS